MALSHRPLLLIDNSDMISLINEGEYKVMNLSFEEAREIIDSHGDDVLKCFASRETEIIMFNYLGIKQREYEYKNIRNMREGQDAIVFKLYITPSETQPVAVFEGVEAKKIQNIYAYCQYISKVK
ncbi:MAG: YddF family protein [Clostridiales bacterium]|nr:YddF family protein [Clostridiales bacterium]